MLRIFSALIFFAVFLSSVFSSIAAAHTSLDFTDAVGQRWHRWILTDVQKGRTLLLVLESPLGAVGDVSQRIVYRQSFARGSHALLKKIDDFKNFRDQKETAFKFVAAPVIEKTRTAHLPIWVIKQNYWTLQNERDYTAWMQNVVTEKFLQGSDINVDCADLSLTLRWVYAHDHGLPVANSLGGAGGLFGQWSGTSAWDHLPTNADWKQDARFKAALRYLLNSAYTHTILNDLYPTEITREYVTPGAIRLTITDAQSGHTQVIHRIGHDPTLCPDGQCVSVFYGDTPASETIYDDVAWLLNLKNGKGGFMRWRWPTLASGQWSLTPAPTMPGYSLEQFSHPSFTTDQYENYINTALFWSTTITDRATTLGYSLIESLQARLQVTALGDVFCALQNCPPNSSAYVAYSTFARDARYLDTRARFIDLVQNDSVDTTADEYQALMQKVQQPLFTGGDLTFADYIFDQASLNEKISSDPTRSFGERWGLTTATSAQTQWANETLWETLWTYRESQVQSAQRLCGGGQGATAACQSLATTIIDSALRNLRLTLRKQMPVLDQLSQAQVMTEAGTRKTAETGQSFCSQLPSRRCTISDFIYSTSPAVDQMSSAPTAAYADRFGL